MRIGLYNGSTLYPLAGQSGVSERVHSSAGDLRITPQAGLQVASKVRATYATHLDRGNISNTISFSTKRTFSTVPAAEQWALDYEGAFPRDGKLVLESIQPNGSALVRVLSTAVVSPPSRAITGCTVSLTYQVQGGAIGNGTAASITINPTGADNSALYTAVTAGPVGNGITVGYATPAAQATTTVAVATLAITVTPGTKARMVVTGVSTAGVNGDLFYAGLFDGFRSWTSDGAEAGGSTQTFLIGYNDTEWQLYRNVAGVTEYQAVGSAGPLTYPDGVTFSAPTIGTGTPTATPGTSSAAQVIAAVNADASAAALVTAAASGTVTGAVAAVTATNLAGGAY